MEGEVKNAIKDNGQEHICDTPEKKGTTVGKNQDAIPIFSFLKLRRLMIFSVFYLYFCIQ